MWYHSFWKVVGALLGVVLVLGLILYGLLVYAQLRQIKGDAVVTTPINLNSTTTNSSLNETITNLIPVTDQKSSANTNTATAANLQNTYIPTIDDDPVIGANTGEVTIIAFEDFQCPYCAAAAPILREVLQQYPNDVKLVFRDFPLYTIHAQSQLAALAGECADDQNAFWQWHDLVYERQSLLSSAPDIFYDWADELGLNQATFQTCITEQKYNDEIARDQNAGILAGVYATPTFYVNGYKVEGTISKEQWSQLIDALLAEQ